MAKVFRPFTTRFLLCLLLVGLTFSRAGAAPWDRPPGEPSTGYGSAEAEISPGFTEYTQGSAAAGDLTWYYVPDTLKYGSSAPVVVFLHGFATLVPALYHTHIEHLVREGNIVIFPQYQKSTLAGFLSEAGLGKAADQNVWARRAVASVNAVLEALGDKVDMDEVYLYGHSLGGLICLAWQADGGVPVRAMVLSHPEVDSQQGIPPFVKSLLHIIEIPWRDYAPAINVPVIILNGTDDHIAPVSQSKAIMALLTSAPSKVLYVAQHDGHGYPPLSPNHGAPLDVVWGLPPHLRIFGISGELDALDWRYYFAALDAVMDGWRDQLPFNMGMWSDGVPVRPVQELH